MATIATTALLGRRRPYSLATHIGLALLVVSGLIGLQGSPASALAPKGGGTGVIGVIPPDNPCLANGPAQILSFTVTPLTPSQYPQGDQPTVDPGTSAALSWNVQLPTIAPCGSTLVLTGPGIDPQGKVVAPRDKPLIVQPPYLGIYEMSFMCGPRCGVLLTPPQPVQVAVNLPLDPDDYRCIARAAASGMSPQGCRHKVIINANNLAPLLVQALGTPNTTVVVENQVLLDLSDWGAITIRDGVRLTGGRIAESGQLFRSGPLLYTNSNPDKLFNVQGDNVRITGLRIRGADYADESFDGPVTTGIEVSDVMPGCGGDGFGICDHRPDHIAVEIDHNELVGWTHAAVRVLDPNGRIHVNAHTAYPTQEITYDQSSEPVYIHDNYIHHNQHLVGNGYGVSVDYGAHALIERNVFDWNRHAISEENGQHDSGRLGYRAYRNLVLEHGGRNSYYSPFAEHTHQFDMHGSDWWGTDHMRGDAGHEYDIRYNSFQYTAGPAIKIRGTPTMGSPGVDVMFNVFAHDYDWDDAVQWTSDLPPVLMRNNLTRVNDWGPKKECDFDGDGIADTFIATGQTLWYCPSSGNSDCVTAPGSGKAATWVYLNGVFEPASPKFSYQLSLVPSSSGPGCDVFDGNLRSVAGTGPWEPL